MMRENLLDTLAIKTCQARFFNLDETGLSLDPKKKCAFYHTGAKNAQMILPTEGKTMYTMFFCGNAAESYMPTYAIYKSPSAKVFDTWMIVGPEGTSYSVTKSGWTEDYVFEAWLKDVLLKYVADIPKPTVVFFDGYGSHITFYTAHKAKEANVHIYSLSSTTYF